MNDGYNYDNDNEVQEATFQQTNQPPAAATMRIERPEQPVTRINRGNKKRQKSAKRNGAGAGRGQGFTEAEQSTMLELIEELKPIGHDQWDMLTERFNRIHPNPGRTAESLRKKFATLYRNRTPTGDPHIPPLVLQAKRLKEMLINEAQIETLDTNEDEEEAEYDDDDDDDDENYNEGGSKQDNVEVEEVFADGPPLVGRTIPRSGSTSSAASAGRTTPTASAGRLTPTPPLARSLNPSFTRAGIPVRSRVRSNNQPPNSNALSYLEMMQQDMMQARIDRQDELHEMQRQYLLERQDREKELARQEAERRYQEEAREAERKAEREEREAERRADREARKEFMEMVMMGVAGVLGATAKFMEGGNKRKRNQDDGDDDDNNN